MLTDLLFSRAFCRPSRVTAGTMGPMGDPWRVPIGQWGPVFAPTGCVAHWCVIGHCVGIMAAHRVSLEVVFATYHPTHLSLSHSTLPRYPSHPPPLLSILMAERDGKKYLEIQPSETEKVSYNKNQ